MKKIQMRGASWDSVFLASAKVLTMLFGILMTKILSEGLTLEEYGTYSQANIINSVGASLIAFGFSDGVNYFYNRQQKGLDDALRIRIVNTVFFVEIILGIALAFIIVLCKKLIVEYFNNTSLYSLIPIVAMLPVMSNLLYFYQVIFVSVGKAKTMALFNLIMVILKIITVYVAVFVFRELRLIFLALLLLELAQITVFNAIASRKGAAIKPWRISVKHIGEIFAYCLPIGVYTLTSVVSRELDKLVIGRVESTEVLAVYSNCSRLLPFDVLAIAFATVLIPHIIRAVTTQDRQKSIPLLSSYMKVGYYSVWILATAVLIAPQTMVSFLYADSYIVGTGIFVIYIFDSMLRFASIHLVLTAANKTKTLMGYSFLALAINLLLNFLLYYMIGVIGPAVATLISNLVYSGLILNQSFKIIDAKWKEIFDCKEIFWLVLTLLLGWMIAAALNQGLLLINIDKYVAMLLSIALFGTGMLAMHFRKIVSILKQLNDYKI